MMDQLNILHCLASYDNRLGGSVHAALNVSKFLSLSGVSVEAVAPYAVGDETDYLLSAYPEFPAHRVKRCFPKRYGNSRELSDWFGRNLHRFQLVEIHAVWVLAALRAARACQRAGVPYLVRPHGSLDPFDLQKHRWMKRGLGPFYARWLLAGSAGVVCTASREAEVLEDYGARVRRHVVPLPVSLSALKGDRERFREKHGIPEKAPVILFMSRIDRKKGLQLLAPALATLRKEYPDLRLVLAGTGEQEFVAEARAVFERNQLSHATIETGFVGGQDKADALAAADIFALPSLNENFGIVLIEAMHAGLPLLISDQVYIADEIANAKAGVICQTTIGSVETGLRELLTDDFRRRKMGEAGKSFVASKYRPESSTEQLRLLYSSVVHDRRGRGEQ